MVKNGLIIAKLDAYSCVISRDGSSGAHALKVRSAISKVYQTRVVACTIRKDIKDVLQRLGLFDKNAREGRYYVYKFSLNTIL